MLQALLSGVASIKAHQTRMNVIGNNLANVNTTAYKGARVGFQDLLSQTIQGASRPTEGRGGTNPIQYGLGVVVSSADANFEQGSLGSTNRPTDLAIQGGGFFAVSVNDRPFYTRDGSFNLDANGSLVHRGTGANVLGWAADVDGNIDTTRSIGPDSGLKVPVGTLNAVQATTSASIAGNLSSGALSTDEVVTSVRVYDSLGRPRDLSVVMKNHAVPATPGGPADATGSWDWEAYEGDPSTGTLLVSSSDPGNERLYFDGNGRRTSNLPPGTTNKATLPASGGALAFDVDLDFAVSNSFANSGISFRKQNGFGPGSLSGISIGSDGIITGIFTNGLNRTMGQVAMATFSNPQGLERASDNLWTTSENSGLPSVGRANTDDRGSINAGYLEQSNVDISSEFTDLIITQRGFQANTKIVSTVDQMLEELINIRR